MYLLENFRLNLRDWQEIKEIHLGSSTFFHAISNLESVVYKEILFTIETKHKIFRNKFRN